MTRRRNIKTQSRPAITITRQSVGPQKLVYLAVANKPRKYPFGYRSPILYIGTTKKGAGRIAQSAAARAETLLAGHGVRQISFHIVRCTPLRKVKTWVKLERALLLAFKHTYGSVPIANASGKNARWRGELDYFSEKRLVAVLRSFEVDSSRGTRRLQAPKTRPRHGKKRSSRQHHSGSTR